MRIAYFDCFSGASGDMILGSLIDVGLSPRRLREELKKLRIPTIALKVKKVLRGGLAATRVIVEGKNEKKSHRNLKEILRIIERSGVGADVKEKSREIFKRIASVEGKIHRTPTEEVHFHELGGLDSIVDIVGSVWGIRQLGIEEIYVSKVNVGAGFVKCEHGILPSPCPCHTIVDGGKTDLFFGSGERTLHSYGSGYPHQPGLWIWPDAADQRRASWAWGGPGRPPPSQSPKADRRDFGIHLRKRKGRGH